MIPNEQVTTSQWLNLPIEVKTKLKAVFNIPHSEGTQIIDNRVTSDGYNHRDLAVITREKMLEYLQDPEASKQQEFYALFSMVLEKIGEEVYAIPKEPEPEVAPAKSVVVTIEVDGHKFIVNPELHDKVMSTVFVPADKTTPSKPKNKGGRPKGSKTTKSAKKSK